MGRGYKQLSLEDRCEIARLQAAGRSIRQIAAALDRPPSTISREFKRNRGRHIGYKPSYAQEQTRARRWSGSRLEREPDLRRAVLERLAKGWSPEQVARPPAPPSRPQGDQLRDHLPLHLRQNRPHKRLPRAALSAARQEQARLAWPQRRQLGKPDRRPYFHSSTARHRGRSQDRRSLGSR